MKLLETGRKYFTDERDDYDSPLAKSILREFAAIEQECLDSESTENEDRIYREQQGYVVRTRPAEGVRREIETPTHLLRITNDGGRASDKTEVFQK